MPFSLWRDKREFSSIFFVRPIRLQLLDNFVAFSRFLFFSAKTKLVEGVKIETLICMTVKGGRRDKKGANRHEIIFHFPSHPTHSSPKNFPQYLWRNSLWVIKQCKYFSAYCETLCFGCSSGRWWRGAEDKARKRAAAVDPIWRRKIKQTSL